MSREAESMNNTHVQVTKQQAKDGKEESQTATYTHGEVNRVFFGVPLVYLAVLKRLETKGRGDNLACSREDVSPRDYRQPEIWILCGHCDGNGGDGCDGCDGGRMRTFLLRGKWFEMCVW